MAYTSWRGTVGVVKPTMRPGSLEEFIRMMPEGIGIIPLFIGFQRGTADEFQQAMKAYEERVAQLAGYGVDLIHPEGAPPFMFQGVKGERRTIRAWERKYKVPMVTAGQTQIEALKALRGKEDPRRHLLHRQDQPDFREVFRGGGIRRAGHGRHPGGLRGRGEARGAGSLRAYP